MDRHDSMTATLDETFPSPPVPRLEIEASVADRITLATYQNDAPVISDLAVLNLGDAPVENLQLVLDCSPPLIASKTWRLDRIAAGGEIRVRDRQVSLSGALLAQINERVRAELRLSVTAADVTLSERRIPLVGLARNEWGGGAHMPELLGAFVMPNDPAIAKVLKDAGEVLRSAGKQPTINGYQSKSRQVVWQLAAAIWSAVSARRLVYAEPPASFESEGQKIRTPSEVLDTGLATCLDTTVLFAAALEQAGLNPVVAFTKGHAFCGVWLQPQVLPTLTAFDCSDVRKHVAAKELVLFETTLVVNEPPMPFAKAIESADRLICEDREADFHYALDIRRARQHQITPLSLVIEPTRIADAAGNASIHVGLDSPPELPGFDLGIDDGPTPDSPETRLEHWKRKLLDLTKNNRLLNLKPSKTTIRLRCSDPGRLEDRISDGAKITVVPMPTLSQSTRDEAFFQSRTGEEFAARYAAEALDRDEVVADASDKDLDSGLVQLYRKARTDLQEGGANTLYLAIGVLKWKQSPDETRLYRAPLLLVPVTLERKSAASKIRIAKHEDDAVFNLTLLELLRQDFALRIPELEGALPMDESGVDVSRVWEIVRRAVRDVPGFEVTEEIVLSTFSFAKYLMWKDLNDRTEALKQSPFVRHLIDHPRDPYPNSAAILPAEKIDTVIDPGTLYMPLQADGSQVVAVHASMQGGDFVLEGPPGTGKSQTIANIIAHNLGLGRRVLFVSEKMAALEVVYRRLREKGLGDFCLELHSNKANKRQVLDQLGQSWRSRRTHTRAEWDTEAARLKRLRDDLNGLVAALHQPGPTGISPRAAIGRSVRWGERHRVRLGWTGGLEADHAKCPADLNELSETAKRLGQAYAAIDASDREVFHVVRHTEWSNAWQSRFVNVCGELLAAMEEFEAATDAFSEQSRLPRAGDSLALRRGVAAMASLVREAAQRHLGFALGSNGGDQLAAVESARQLLLSYRKTAAELPCPYPIDTIQPASVEAWTAEWARVQAKAWPFRSLSAWLLRRRLRKQLKLPVLPNLASDLPSLKELLSLQQRMDVTTRNLPTDSPWRGLETDESELESTLSLARDIREATARLAADVAELTELRASVHRLLVEGRELLQDGMPCAAAAQRAQQAAATFEATLANYLNEAGGEMAAVTKLSELRSQARGILELQPRINAWCRWQRARQEAEAAQLKEFVSALENGSLAATDVEEAFQTAYCDWLATRLIDAREPLRTFAAVDHEEKIRLFRELDQKLATLATDFIRARLSGEVPDPDDQHRDAGYGVLARELQKKMRHLPVRQLIDKMGSSLTALTPCLLMSPLSASQYLAAGSQLFDLVVFDEASQITVWDAIGAIARGRNVIVVGDPKQMPPTSFFDRSASGDDEDEDGLLSDDLESILDEALAASVKLHRLTGHYRSRHESLIAFSNHRYYGGDLVTFPAAETRETAVSFRKIDGLYQRGSGRTNPAEAKAIVAEIVQRLTHPERARLSLGVVTMNADQQRLIDDLLDQERRANPELEKYFGDDVSEPVFVKNLETVQGDQRDVILLSVGYGPDTPGARTMSMNFGPLNKKGGERRLNVAITRATSEVVLFASFDPSMIDLTRTSANAVRDLRHYMEFAQRGPAALGEAVLSVGGLDQYESEFEEAVADGMRRRGWSVHTQIGVSKFRVDLGIVHPDAPGRYLAGIECDGATYHRSPSARDRDRVRQAILENLGWKLVRIWSTDFFIDPRRTLDKVHDRLQELYEAEPREAKQVQADPRAVPTDLAGQETRIMEAAAVVRTKGWGTTDVPVTEAVSTLRGASSGPSDSDLDPERFYEDDYLPVLRRFACRLIDELGPITLEDLVARVSRAHQFKRAGKQIRAQVQRAVSKARARTEVRGVVFWPDRQEPQKVVGYRGKLLGGVERDWADVPYAEKLGLAHEVAATLSGEDALAALAARIGIGRLSRQLREELEELLLEQGRTFPGA